MTKANIAPSKWAQRSDFIYLTINLPDVRNEVIDLTETHLNFKYVLLNLSGELCLANNAILIVNLIACMI